VGGEQALDPAPDERHHDRELGGRPLSRLAVAVPRHIVKIV